MTTGAEDRLELLENQSALTGVDFIYVYETQDRLDVYFLRPPEALDSPLPGTIAPSAVRIENVRDKGAPDVEITGLDWKVAHGRTVMRLNVVRPASFADHRLTISDPATPSRIDPYYASKVFSFQVNCETGLDCESAEPPPFPETFVDFPVDYSARDFLSFRRSLLDFAAQRYPQWVDRLEADVGVMLTEVMSALADEMAYSQDRISREAYLETATQRLSLRRHARLVDYEPFDGQAASTMLDFTASGAGAVPVGARVTDADGVYTFEAGTGLFDENASYGVDPARNRFSPYYWDEDDVELPAGSVELYVEGAAEAAFPPSSAGSLILLQTDPADPSDPAARLFVRLLDVHDEMDPLTGKPISRLTWDEPTPYRLDKTALTVRGNIVPATGGLTRRVLFTVGSSSDPDAPELHAVARRGADGAAIHRFSLPDSGDYGLAYLYSETRGGLRAEIRLYEAARTGGSWQPIPAGEWEWRSSLLGVASSTAFDRRFTLDDGTWGRVAGFPVPGGLHVHEGYRSAGGLTIRFGDGEFGMAPPEGGVFAVDYRLNTGSSLPRATLTRIDPENPLPFVVAVTNPEAASGALPAESAASIRASAPEAFREVAYRAVKTADYAEAAERLAWVQSAGASSRWTGSWRTVFVSADPLGAVELDSAQRTDLDQQIERFRQAGRDARQRPPRYADLDFEITLCAEPSSYAGAVREAVTGALSGPGGFFASDRFTFGTVLHRGALEAAIGAAPGVLAVQGIRFRRRGWFNWRWFGFLEAFYDPGIDAIIRVQNDRLHPEQGMIEIIVNGGA